MLLWSDCVDRVVYGALHHAHVDLECRWGTAVRPRNSDERRRRDLVPASHLTGVGSRGGTADALKTPSVPTSAPTATGMNATDRLRDIVLLLVVPAWVGRVMASSSTPSSAWRDRRDSVPTHMASETNQSGQSSRHASVSVRRAGHVHRFRPMSRPSDKRQTTADVRRSTPERILQARRCVASRASASLPRMARAVRKVAAAEHRREWRTPRCHPVGRAHEGRFTPSDRRCHQDAVHDRLVPAEPYAEHDSARTAMVGGKTIWPARILAPALHTSAFRGATTSPGDASKAARLDGSGLGSSAPRPRSASFGRWAVPPRIPSVSRSSAL